MTRTIIGVTGPIASGKSTAIKMLQARPDYDPKFSFTYHDLDNVCKTANVNTKDFFQKHFKTSFLSKIDIVAKVFTNESLYEEYCDLFVDTISDYLNSLPDGIHIVESSALPSYPEVFNLYNIVLCLKPDTNVLINNRKDRGISGSIFDIIFYRNVTKLAYSVTNFNFVLTNHNTLLELRSVFEKKLICSLDTSYHDQFNLLNCLKDNFPNINPYHNFYHTLSVLNDLILTGRYTRELGLVAIFHDFIYDPSKTDNEEQSAKYVLDHYQEYANRLYDFNKYNWGNILNLIKQTKYDMIKPNTDLHSFFLSDVSHWNRTPEEIIESEQLMFKEYQHVNWHTYKKTRIQILQDISSQLTSLKALSRISLSISWLNTFKPKIGWFVGSFNPFTTGHLDILRKSEQIFDKVILVQAINPNKYNPIKPLTEYKSLNNQIITDVKSIPELINSVGYKPTLIRGIRDSDDYKDAVKWYEQIKLFADAELVLIQSDVSQKHISSSFVRAAKQLSLDVSKFEVD